MKDLYHYNFIRSINKYHDYYIHPVPFNSVLLLGNIATTFNVNPVNIIFR